MESFEKYYFYNNLSLKFLSLFFDDFFYQSLGAIFADCFVKDYTKRIEIGQLLNHEFFEESPTGNVTIDSTCASTTVSQPNVSRAVTDTFMQNALQFMTPNTQQKVKKAMKRAEEN